MLNQHILCCWGEIHGSKCVSLTLHQFLIFWDGDQVEMIHANRFMFKVEVHIVEAIYYSPFMKLIQCLECMKRGHVLPAI